MQISPVDPLSGARLRVVLATVGINVVVVALLAFAPWSNWRSAVALNLVDNALLLGFVVRRRDGFLARLMVFGVAVGFAELAADAWLVDYTRTLDYSPGGGPMLWRSPLWMPFAWETVAVQLGYIGLRLWERYGVGGLLAVGVLGAVNIPYYEQMARSVHWWTYRGCRMASGTPLYIIVGEFGIAVALALLTKPLRAEGWARPVLLGVVGGAAIFVCYTLAYGVTDGFARAGETR